MLPVRQSIKHKIIISIFAMVCVSFTVAAQTIVKTNITPYTLSFHPVKERTYQAFVFPLSKTINYSNYPLTANQILRRESQIRAYDLLTNRNKNGFINNILGHQRNQHQHANPGF